MHGHSRPWSMLRLVSSRLLLVGGTHVASYVLMDSKSGRQEKVSHRRELYRVRMVSETPEEKEVRLIKQRNYMYRKRANEHQQ